MFNFFMRDEIVSDYETKLKEATKDLNSRAIDIDKTECNMSGYCCWRRSCELRPKEIKKIADFMKLSEIDFIKQYCMIDVLNMSDTYFLRLANKTHKDENRIGTFIESKDSWIVAPCIMWDKAEGCKINEVKPQSGITYNCWDEKEYPSITEYWVGDNLLTTLYKEITDEEL